MTKRNLGVVGTSRDAAALLQEIRYASPGLNEAVQLGSLVRVKITGWWLYSTSTAAIEAAMIAVEGAAIEQLRAWLIGGFPYLRGPVSRSVQNLSVTSSGVEVLLHALVRDERIGALPLLSKEYEPYLGLYAPDDEGELDRQVGAMKVELSKRGYVTWTDLPEPVRARQAKAWRPTVLQHGEYLGLGRREGGALVAWELPGDP